MTSHGRRYTTNPVSSPMDTSHTLTTNGTIEVAQDTMSPSNARVPSTISSQIASDSADGLYTTFNSSNPEPGHATIERPAQETTQAAEAVQVENVREARKQKWKRRGKAAAQFVPAVVIMVANILLNVLT